MTEKEKLIEDIVDIKEKLFNETEFFEIRFLKKMLKKKMDRLKTIDPNKKAKHPKKLFQGNPFFVFLILLTISCNLFAKIDIMDIDKLCKRYDTINCSLVKAIIWQESSFNENAFNPEKTGSYGLGQIQCATAKLMGLKYSCDQLYSPAINIRFMTKYLQHINDNNTIREIIATYNAGSVIRCKNHTPGKCYPGEFINEKYVWEVMRKYNYIKGEQYARN